MLKRCYLLILLVFLATSCMQRKQEQLPPVLYYSQNASIQYRPVSNFSDVDVKGQININLHTGYKKPQLSLKGDPRDLAQLKVVVINSKLYLALGNGYPQHGAVSADIRGRFLNSVHYVGAGMILGKQIQSRFLELDLNNQGITQLNGNIGLHRLVLNGGMTGITGISSPWLYVRLKGNAKVQLNGVTNLASLNIDGGGWLSLYWVKSDNLRIRAKQTAKIQLAGTVNRLDVELWGNSLFKGRYLRAQRSFVKTHERSTAEISAVNHQSTLAMDASDIYYYNLSNTRADFMADNGSVLDMREWSRYDFEDFTRYNKQFP